MSEYNWPRTKNKNNQFKLKTNRDCYKWINDSLSEHKLKLDLSKQSKVKCCSNPLSALPTKHYKSNFLFRILRKEFKKVIIDFADSWILKANQADYGKLWCFKSFIYASILCSFRSNACKGQTVNQKISFKNLKMNWK